MRKIFSVILLYILLFFCGAIAWADENDSYKIYAPSPQAYAFAQYAEMPVSLYTGTPSIEIPLYTIELNGFSFPITLSYHASGIKVSQEASWVGLGWNLNVGGGISRTVKGMDDLIGGYYSQDVMIPKDVDESRTDIISLVNIDNITVAPKISVDTEPDIFYYNFMGYVGKFYSKNNGVSSDNGFWLSAPEENLKISFSYENDELYFHIIDENGIEYIFFPSCSSKSTSLHFDGIKGPYMDMTKFPFSDSEQAVIVGWDLAEVILPNKESLRFEYDMVNYPFLPSSSNIEQKKFHPLGKLKNDGTDSTIPAFEETIFSCDKIVYQYFLKKITWSSGSIDFQTADRMDFGVNTKDNGGKYPRLIKMSVFDNLGISPVKEIVFHESYFENIKEKRDFYNMRLKLDSVSVNYGTIKDVYKFGYDMRNDLPPKYSLSQDIYGYYNGNVISDSYFLPEVSISKDYYDLNGNILYKKGEILSGRRKIGQDYITTAMLTMIESPEGAVTNFKYEPNEVTSTFYKTVMKDDLIFQKESDVIVDTLFFTLNNTSYLSLFFEYSEGLLGESLKQPGNYKDHMIDICNISGEIIKSFGSRDFPKEKYNYTIKDSCEYAKGQYYLIFKTDNFLKQELNLKIYEKQSVIESVYAGGVRISQITSPIGIKDYIYDSSNEYLTSGIYVRDPYMESLQARYDRYDEMIDGINTYLVQHSTPVYPLVSPLSNVCVGYSKVKTVIRGDGVSLTEIYDFNNRKEDVSTLYLGVPGKFVYTNGKLKTYCKYDGDQLIQKKEIKYDTYSVSELYAWFQDFSNLGDIVAYQIPIEFCRKTEELVQTFDKETSDVNTVVTTYGGYNLENYKPNNVLIDDGIHEKNINTVFSCDLVSVSPYKEMCNINQISVPIELNIYRDNELIKKELSVYKKNSQNQSFVKDAFYEFNYGSAFIDRDFTGNNVDVFGSYKYRYDYDCYNNIIEIKNRTGESSVYIWGYCGQYLIASIFNSTKDEVMDKIGDISTLAKKTRPSDSDFDKLNSLRTLLPNSEIYTYEYEPMIGITSMTDPSGLSVNYEYDSKGRLVLVRDNDGNIVKTYEYIIKKGL